ncbi:MAG: hypothetical protein IH991_20890 [Planctomycetes bacterium]|nr:hypothetical protein [Planctomycetota bacterium]
MQVPIEEGRIDTQPRIILSSHPGNQKREDLHKIKPIHCLPDEISDKWDISDGMTYTPSNPATDPHPQTRDHAIPLNGEIGGQDIGEFANGQTINVKIRASNRMGMAESEAKSITV